MFIRHCTICKALGSWGSPGVFWNLGQESAVSLSPLLLPFFLKQRNLIFLLPLQMAASRDPILGFLIRLCFEADLGIDSLQLAGSN